MNDEDVGTANDLQHYMEATSRLTAEAACLEARIVELEWELDGTRESLQIAKEMHREMCIRAAAAERRVEALLVKQKELPVIEA